tara:strand:- start:20 stop:388 length:369 start_codon:yes stop_codon:yes gene_type:complete
MSFDSENIKRLKNLQRQLPKKLPIPDEKLKSKIKKYNNYEENKYPEKLFQDIINESEDGTIPIHLLKRLKKLEEKQTESNSKLVNNDSKSEIIKSQNKKNIDSSIDDNHYILFKKLLLEEED